MSYEPDETDYVELSVPDYLRENAARLRCVARNLELAAQAKREQARELEGRALRFEDEGLYESEAS